MAAPACSDPRWPAAPELPAGHPCALCRERAGSPCAALDADSLAQLRSGARDLQLQSGQSLYRQDNAADALYLLRAGLLRLTVRDAEGREQVLAFRGPGALVGLTAQARHHHGAEPVLPSRLCRWPTSAAALVERHPALAAPLLRAALDALDGARAHLMRLGLHAASARLAGFLLELAAAEPDAQTLTLPMTRADIAAYLGMNKESVSRSFTQLRRVGAIALARPDRVQLLCPERLRAAACAAPP